MSKRSRFAFLLFSPAGWLACYTDVPRLRFTRHDLHFARRAFLATFSTSNVERAGVGCKKTRHEKCQRRSRKRRINRRAQREQKLSSLQTLLSSSKFENSILFDPRFLSLARGYRIEEEEKIFLKNHKLGKINIGLVAKIIRKAKILLETTKWRKNKANILTPVPTGGWFTPRRKPVHHEFFDRPIPSCGQYEIRPRHTRFFSPSPLPFFCRLVSVTRDSRLLAFESLKLILMGIFMAVGERWSPREYHW